MTEVSKDIAIKLPEHVLAYKKLANELVEEYKQFWFAENDVQRTHIKNFIEKDIGSKFRKLNTLIFNIIEKYEQDPKTWYFLNNVDIKNAKTTLDDVFSLLIAHNIPFEDELSK